MKINIKVHSVSASGGEEVHPTELDELWWVFGSHVMSGNLRMADIFLFHVKEQLNHGNIFE